MLVFFCILPTCFSPVVLVWLSAKKIVPKMAYTTGQERTTFVFIITLANVGHFNSSFTVEFRNELVLNSSPTVEDVAALLYKIEH